MAYQAVTGKQGFQRLGDRNTPFDFEQYFVATIAHNCLLLWDPARLVKWYGRPYEPAGSQRLIENTCNDFAASVEGSPRQTARLLAYGQRHGAAYAALDLTPAYDPRSSAGYTREFIFLGPRVLTIVDRLKRRPAVDPIWVINIPSRPTVDGAELSEQTRLAGSDNRAGIWDCDRSRWLRWGDADGCLQMTSLLPAERKLRVVGGPGDRISIADGPVAGLAYLGSGPDGFEHLICPATHFKPTNAKPMNAWYRLGQPTRLGPAFGQSPHWGRIEIEPTATQEQCVFLTLLFIEPADATEQPVATLELSDDGMHVVLKTGVEHLELRLPHGSDWGGSIERRGRQSFGWILPKQVQSDDPLPVD